MSRPSPSSGSSRRASSRAMTRSRTRPRSSTISSASSPSPISAATTSPISRPTRSARRCSAAASIRTGRRASSEGYAPPAAPVSSVVSKGLLRSRPGDKLMLVRSGAGDAPAVQVVGGSSAHGGFVQGATALKGELAERDRAPPGREPRAASRNGRREARRSADERLRRRSLPRMRQLHHGAQRHLPEVRHLRRHDGVQLKLGQPSWPGLTRPPTR